MNQVHAVEPSRIHKRLAVTVSAALCSLLLAACSPALSLLAGNAGGSGTADATRTLARFNLPQAAATDGAGNLYVADSFNFTIRKIAANGTVTTLAGTPGVIGASDGRGSAASFFFPSGVAADKAGNVYVADTGNDTIRKITPDGTVTTLAGLAESFGYADGAGPAEPSRERRPARVP